jgi:hypothetical protein
MSEYMYVSDVVDLFTFMCFKAIAKEPVSTAGF